MEITMKSLCSQGSRTFEVVDKIPVGYTVWNIGDNMVDGYIPLAKPVGPYEIDPWTLKAIKIDDASDLKLLREGAHHGIISLNTAIKASEIKNTRSHHGKHKKFLGEMLVVIYERLS